MDIMERWNEFIELIFGAGNILKWVDDILGWVDDMFLEWVDNIFWNKLIIFYLRPDPPMIGSKLLYKFGGKLLLEKCDWSKCCELKNGK